MLTKMACPYRHIQMLGLLTMKQDDWDLERKPPAGSSGAMPLLEHRLGWLELVENGW